MNRLKTAAALLLTGMLIAALALLPQGVAGVSDLLTREKPGIASMQSVELAFDSDKAEQPGYMMRKLALEQRMSSLPIEPERASMTEEEVILAAKTGMDHYTQVNMFDWFDYTFCSAESYLGIDSEDENNNAIFWGVTFTREDNPYQSLFLHIDDETGKILLLRYETYGPDQEKYAGRENQRLMMGGLVDAFFGPLDLNRRNEYENLLDESVMENSLSEDVTCVVYTLEDAEYGTIHVAFHITPEGFHVYYPRE